ncbi:hypothetical protein HC928_26065, partial [bacterium]|nr:hypothetical protein [bacterium]
TPFVLAEPLEGVDYVIGLAIVREARKPARASDPVEVRLTAIARVYKGDGEFVRYTVRELRQHDESLPYVLMRDLFPSAISPASAWCCITTANSRRIYWQR